MLVSYAQNFEDVILWRALAGVEHGFYIDVGAQDPLVDSVSLAFYEHGWRGVHVEPTPGYAAKLRAARPDEDVIQAAIGARAGTISFFEIENSGLSTGDPEIAHRHAAAGWTVRRSVVPCLPLGTILDTQRDRDVHWLKIDVEGMERQVIEGWPPSPVRPWIVVVESTRPNSPEPTHADWEPELLSLGYDFVYFDGLNRFYVSRAHPELKAGFGPGPHVFDGFVLSARGGSPFAGAFRAEIAALRRQVSDEARRGAERERQHEAAQAALRREHEAGQAALRLEHERDEAALRQAHEREQAALRREHERDAAALCREHERRQAALEHEADALRRRLDEVFASTSWRITAPARFASLGLRWVMGGARAWLTLKPGSRPRRVAGRAVAGLARQVAGQRWLAAPARRFLARFPSLRNRVRALTRPAIRPRLERGALPLLRDEPEGVQRLYRRLAEARGQLSEGGSGG